VCAGGRRRAEAREHRGKVVGGLVLWGGCGWGGCRLGGAMVGCKRLRGEGCVWGVGGRGLSGYRGGAGRG